MKRWIKRLMIQVLSKAPDSVLFPLAKGYVSGPDISDAIQAVRRLNAQGAKATVDFLGESTRNKQEVKEVLATYTRLVDEIASAGVDADISLKPTHLGLLIDREFFHRNIRTLVQHAAKHGIFVCMDMEASPTVDATLESFVRLQDEGLRNIGWVSQSMLRRAVLDMKSTLKYKPRVRICKGVYREAFDQAFATKEAIHRNFGLLGKLLAQAGGYPCFATHNEELIWESLNVVHSLDLTPDQYEFQTLFGVKEELVRVLSREGHRVRVYVPFGKNWKRYIMRRLAETPDLFAYIKQTLFGNKKPHSKARPRPGALRQPA